MIYEMTPDEIELKIKEYLPIRNDEKHEFGEVFTPIELINNMLDELPPAVWINPDLIWLDPACGIGNFFMIVFQRLMKTLKIPKTKRAAHIINMLYMIDINPDNIKIARTIFGKDAHIFCKDFLTFDLPVDCNIILANPPFNIATTELRHGAKGSGFALWGKFLKKSLEITKNYVGMLTPSVWRSPDHELLNLVKQYKLLYLHIFSKSDGIKWFGVQSRFDIYVISKKGSNYTKIIDQNNRTHKIQIKEWPFLPNYNYTNIKRILATIDNLPILYHSNIYNSKDLKEKDRLYKYPVVHTITRTGLGIRYSDKPNLRIPKVLLNFNELQYPYNDWKGEYGMSQLTFGIPIQTRAEGNILIDAINTPEFKEIIKSTKWTSFTTNYKMFRYFKHDFYKFL